MNKENLRKAVEAFLSPKKTKVWGKLPRSMEYPLPLFTPEPMEQSPEQRPMNAIRRFPNTKSNCWKGIWYFWLKKGFPEPNGDEKTCWKIEEQFGPRSHPQAFIQQLAPRVFETVQVPKIEWGKLLKHAKGPRECWRLDFAIF